MSNAGMSPVEEVLRLVAAAAPGPWSPDKFAAGGGVDEEVLHAALDELWLERLIVRAPGGEDGEVMLSPLGERVLREPEALRRLREGGALFHDDPGAVVRNSLRHPIRPVFSRLILWANVAVFAYGAYLAYGVPKLLPAYLIGLTRDPRVADALTKVLHAIGSVRGQDLLNGEWWRLLTSCFVHAGLLHLGLNMFALRSIGTFVEQTWGRWRFLVIYFLSGWGGSCLAMAYAPGTPVVGASGALFGLFATVIVGLLLYGKHLPAGMRRRMWRGVVINVVLMAALSWGLRSYLSHWGHLGGAVGGAVTAVVLHLQRFGPPPVRWLALAALIPLPWAGLVVIDQARARSEGWHQLDAFDFLRRYSGRVTTTNGRAIRAFEENVYRLVEETHHTRRNPRKVARALEVIAAQRENLSRLADDLDAADGYRGPKVEKARQAGLAYTRACAALYERAEQRLSDGTRWTREDENLVHELLDRKKEWEEVPDPE